MKTISSRIEEVLHLFFPHLCVGCGTDGLEKDHLICYECLSSLPKTRFENIPNNPVEKLFFGRLKIEAAYSEFYFSKGQILQKLIHDLKYKGNKEMGFFLGELMGYSLLDNSRFKNIDLIVPLPMFKDKELKRGYNQATIIANGISNVLNISVNENLISKRKLTATQTRKDRSERWLNVEESFTIENSELLKGKNILLVDDVITTGATIEACGQILLEISQVKLSVASLALTMK